MAPTMLGVPPGRLGWLATCPIWQLGVGAMSTPCGLATFSSMLNLTSHLVPPPNGPDLILNHLLAAPKWAWFNIGLGLGTPFESCPPLPQPWALILPPPLGRPPQCGGQPGAWAWRAWWWVPCMGLAAPPAAGPQGGGQLPAPWCVGGGVHGGQAPWGQGLPPSHHGGQATVGCPGQAPGQPANASHCHMGGVGASPIATWHAGPQARCVFECNLGVGVAVAAVAAAAMAAAGVAAAGMAVAGVAVAGMAVAGVAAPWATCMAPSL